jgi:hypothetical protein
MQSSNPYSTIAAVPRNQPLKSLVERLKRLQQTVANTVAADRFHPQIHKFAHGRDLWWYTFDPRTGQCIYADSEAELRLWIEQNYQGR